MYDSNPPNNSLKINVFPLQKLETPSDTAKTYEKTGKNLKPLKFRALNIPNRTKDKTHKNIAVIIGNLSRFLYHEIATVRNIAGVY